MSKRTFAKETGTTLFTGILRSLKKPVPFIVRSAICRGLVTALVAQACLLPSVAANSPVIKSKRVTKTLISKKSSRALQGGNPIVLFGPQQFDYQPGPARTVYQEVNLPIAGSAAGTIRIQNGTIAGTNRVTGAIIQLNGTSLSTARTLNQNTATLDIPAIFQPTNNLSVRLVGAPGSFLSISGLILTPLAITTLVPSSGIAGTSVMINGTGFDPRSPNGNIVTFTRTGGGQTTAQVNSFSTTQLTVIVPGDAATGPVRVQNDASAAVSPVDFVVTSQSTIADFNPKRGPEATLVTITGNSLKPDAGNPEVTFAGSDNSRLPAVVTFATDTEVRAMVPPGAVTGPIGISNSMGSTLTVPVFSVETPQNYQITLAPASGVAVQGSSAKYTVSLTSNQASFTQLAMLSVTGLPAEITASFTPQQITAGASSTLTLVVPGNVAATGYNFTVEAKAQVEGSEQTRTADGSISIQTGGQTSLAGRVLSTEDEPIMGATVSIDGITAMTDAAGNFLMSGIAAGTDRPLMIDGRTASAPNRTYPVITEPVTVVASQVNMVPHTFYLPAIDTANEVTLVPGQTNVITTPAIPGLSLTIPANAQLTNRDGTPVTRVSLTPVPIDRTPAPLPPNIGARLIFTAQPGGAQPAPGVVMPVTYPNLSGAAPGATIQLWYFNHDTAQWQVYGNGKVSNDGSSIVPNAGVGLPDFSWSFAPPPIPEECEGGECCKECPCPTTSSPVVLSSGTKTERVTDFEFGGARGGLKLERIFTTNLARSCTSCPFGIGWSHNFRITSGIVSIPNLEPLTAFVQWPGETRSHLFRAGGGGGIYTPSISVYPHMLGDRISGNPGASTYRFKNGDVLVFTGGRLTSMMDRNGNTTTLEYTGNNLTRVTDPVGRSIIFEYNSSNYITRVTDPLNRVWQYTYTGSFLTAVTDPMGQITRYTYDTANRLLTGVIDKRQYQAKQIIYDNQGRVIEQRFPNGGFEKYEYIFSGTIITGVNITDALGRTKSRRFNSSGQVIETTDELGQNAKITRNITTNQTQAIDGPCGCREEQREYDGWGNITAITDRMGKITRYEYELIYNNLTRMTDRLGRVTTYTYDAKGNRTAMTDAFGQTTTYAYDSFGQLISITNPLGHTTQMEYDTLGNITARVDPLNNRTTYEYDLVGRDTAEVDPLGRRTERSYDPLGRIITKKDTANVVTRYEYDPNGNLIGKTNALNHQWRMKYNGRNQILTETDPLGRTTRHEYDSMGNKTAEVSPSKSRISYGYNALDRRVIIQDGLGGVMRYGYDNRGNQISITDQRNNTTIFTYDQMDRKASQRDPLGRSISFEYDAESNNIAKVDRLGRRSIMSYDALNRLANVNYVDAAVTYNYDPAGRLITINDTQGGTIDYSYDNAGRLLSEQTSQGLVSYTYNQAGQRATLTAANAPIVTYAYDAAGRLSAITQNNETFSYTHDILSRVQSLQRPNGVTTNYQYDSFYRLTRLTHASTLATIEDFQYLYNDDDEISTITSLASSTLLPSAKTVTTADAANRISQFGPANYIFDDEGQMTSKINEGGTTTYNWDARGRLTSVGLPGGQTASYDYDARGRRINRVESGVATSFLYDDVEIIRDVASSGSVVDYLNGQDIDQKLRQTGVAGTFLFLGDHLNSTVGLTTNFGAHLGLGISYEAFGAFGSDALTRYTYTGRELDQATGLLYYRARYYDMNVGRFISEDPLQFDGEANFYAYVNNNPINNNDPLGLIFGPLKCIYYLWRFSDVVEKCEKELIDELEATEDLEDVVECLAGKGGSGVADARWRCIKKRDPDAFEKLFKNCKSGLGASRGIGSRR